MKKLKSYKQNQKEKHVPVKKKPSGVACPCKNVSIPSKKKTSKAAKGPCPGEMMFMTPKVPHPQEPDLHRAVCSCNGCNYQGWV